MLFLDQSNKRRHYRFLIVHQQMGKAFVPEHMVLNVTKHKSVVKENEKQATGFDCGHPRIALTQIKEQSSAGFRMNLCIICQLLDKLYPERIQSKNSTVVTESLRTTIQQYSLPLSSFNLVSSLGIKYTHILYLYFF